MQTVPLIQCRRLEVEMDRLKNDILLLTNPKRRRLFDEENVSLPWWLKKEKKAIVDIAVEAKSGAT